MRLSKKEIEIIKSVIYEIFYDAQIYLFGSRLDNKKGGDIDLFIVPKDKANLYEKKIKAIAKLENILNKPVDVIVHKDFKRGIEQEALKGEIL